MSKLGKTGFKLTRLTRKSRRRNVRGVRRQHIIESTNRAEAGKRIQSSRRPVEYKVPKLLFSSSAYWKIQFTECIRWRGYFLRSIPITMGPPHLRVSDRQWRQFMLRYTVFCYYHIRKYVTHHNCMYYLFLVIRLLTTSNLSIIYYCCKLAYCLRLFPTM